MGVKIKTWVSAARLRTLPLSIAGIITGTALAVEYHTFSWAIFVFAILTTLGLQILSNFANDYGDGVKGTDNEERIGPMRALQSGIITDKEMKKAMIITSVITMIFALILIYLAFGKENFAYSLLFFVLGLASVGAAGIPSAGLVMLFIVTDAVGLKSDAVALWVGSMLAIDRPLDMFRTMVNITSDSVGAAVIAKSEGEKLY